MKIYVFSAMAFCIAFTSSFGRIINAYEKDIETARASLRHLNRLPKEKNVLHRLEAVKALILYYEVTETLLHHFQLVSPSLYQQIDTISDYYGRPVDVYVRFVPRSGILAGTLANTNLDQHEADEHAYVSQYGTYTVAVEILVVRNSLQILAHEFGHISYQVPNLSSYVAFFKRTYTNRQMKADYLGHKPNDPSAQRANAFEQLFKKNALVLLRSKGRRAIDPLVLVDEIRQKV